MEKMQTIYKSILDRFEGRKFGFIDFDDYACLVRELIIDYLAHENGGEEIPEDYYELRNWVYSRIMSDIKYQKSSYTNEHFCIGVVFGVLQMFDELTYDKTFQQERILNGC